ncbi:MAG TPA: nuclear transport factor 2 family protein, partial [Blastocatellia bacterium]|nr:nuclear transport factor 2 family protein [Blastocatellia bacterium]
QTWREARKRGDTEAMSRLMAEEWTATNSDGLIITKERELAGAKAGNWKDRPINIKDKVTARAYGDTAVLTFRVKNETGYSQAIEVWVKRQGRWQWIVGQSTKLAEQQPQ